MISAGDLWTVIYCTHGSTSTWEWRFSTPPRGLIQGQNDSKRPSNAIIYTASTTNVQWTYHTHKSTVEQRSRGGRGQTTNAILKKAQSLLCHHTERISAWSFIPRLMFTVIWYILWFPMIYQMHTKQVFMKIQCVQLSCCFGCTSISFAVCAQIPQKLLYTYSYHHQFKHNEMNYYDLE